MQTENIDSQEAESIRKELQSIKDRINLIEATLDIQKWKQSYFPPPASDPQEKEEHQ